MITVVDTSVLLDVFLIDDQHGPRSRQWLRTAYDEGAVIACDLVYAELVPVFGDRAALDALPAGWRSTVADPFGFSDRRPPACQG